MNYPVWYLPETGGGLLIALIAIFHVFVSHFAVGGGLYLIYAEKKGLKENSQQILDFTKQHARFFLLVTMVFGSITGVGIWFIIALVSPAAVSYLIHSFVFGWAAEWVFFVVEIAAAFVYFYIFGKMDSKTHLKVGWLYFFAAWMSLLLINGIIGAMLTPGGWAESLDFWEGFFNPSFWPSLFFRTAMAVLIAACYGFVTASFHKNRVVKIQMSRFSGLWGLGALIAAIPTGMWYLSVLPEQAADLFAGKSPTIATAIPFAIAGFVFLLVLLLSAGVLKPEFNLKPVAGLTLVAAFVFFGSFEWSREAARRPYVINEVIYSNSIMKKDVNRLNKEGFLHNALWVKQKAVTPENIHEAGRELFIHQCYACHTVGGINNDIVALTEKMTHRGLNAYIQRIHNIRYFMPPFAGTEVESAALAAYIAGDLHGKEIVVSQKAAGEPPGGILFEENCSSCHEASELQDALEGSGAEEIVATLETLGEISEEMQAFAGSDEEKNSLAAFLGKTEQGGQ